MVARPHLCDARPCGYSGYFCRDISPRPFPVSIVLMNFLKKLWQGWKAFAHVLGKIQTVILLTVFYFLVLGPISIVFRLLGKSPLPYQSKNPDTNWKLKAPHARGETQYFQQY